MFKGFDRAYSWLRSIMNVVVGTLGSIVLSQARGGEDGFYCSNERDANGRINREMNTSVSYPIYRYDCIAVT